ncbi:tripartite tricarboxylate transporter substrate binding protein [soil metagenome]
MKLIHSLCLSLCTLGVAAGSQLAHAQAYPSKAVRLIVPFSPGTAADIVARQLGKGLADIWGQPVVIDNIQGTGGGIGAATAARAAPDGYTLLMVGANHAINPSLYKDLTFDIVRDFKQVARVASGPLVIIANPALPANTIPELVALAKAKPGTINFGSGGNGSITHLSFEVLKSQAGINLTHVPYKGISQMMSDILGNQIALGSPALASAVPNIKAGKLKALAVTSAKRSPLVPDVPTMAEGGLPGYDVTTWNGVMAPAGTPDAIVSKVYGDIAKVVATREFIDQLQPQALDPALQTGPEFRRFLSAEVDMWAKVAKESGAKLD